MSRKPIAHDRRNFGEEAIGEAPLRCEREGRVPNQMFRRAPPSTGDQFALKYMQTIGDQCGYHKGSIKAK